MLVQRVKHAKVTVDGNVTGAIKQGYLVLLGIAPEDTTEIMAKNGGQAAAAADLLGRKR